MHRFWIVSLSTFSFVCYYLFATEASSSHPHEFVMVHKKYEKELDAKKHWRGVLAYMYAQALLRENKYLW